MLISFEGIAKLTLYDSTTNAYRYIHDLWSILNAINRQSVMTNVPQKRAQETANFDANPYIFSNKRPGYCIFWGVY